MRAIRFVAPITAGLCWVSAARAQQTAVVPEPDAPAAPEAPAKDAVPAWETEDHERRGDFTIGVSAGLGFGASNGFPNDSKKIGRSEYYTESGLGFASGSSIWVGGAFADWMSFGVGMGFSTILTGGTRTQAPAALFHTDVYPLYPLGGAFRDLGGMFQVGLGFPTTESTDDDAVLIDGAGSSYIFAGAFWEGFSAWKLRMGPFAGVHYLWSESIRRPAALIGFRTALFSSP